MAEPGPLPNPPTETEAIPNGNMDVEMKDEAIDPSNLDILPPNPFQAPEAAPTPPIQTPTHLPIQQQQLQQPQAQPQPPSQAHTPSRNSPHPAPPPQQSAPTHPNPHGSSTRVYLNQNVTPHLLEAMKHLATQEPEKPLKWLADFLANKSLEVEGP